MFLERNEKIKIFNLTNVAYKNINKFLTLDFNMATKTGKQHLTTNITMA